MANEEQLAILRQGVEVWNKWRERNPGVVIDLTASNLREADLKEVDLRRANLKGVTLKGSILIRASLIEADISGSNLNGADLSFALLSGASLVGSDLRKADFSMANLSGAYLCGAILRKTNFSLALSGLTNFGDLDMAEAIGLDQMKHFGPSTVGTDTLALSKGQIPEVFLRGCGLSDWEIEQAKLYNPDLSNDEINQILYKIYDVRATQALQISPLFVSYSHADSEFADKIGYSLTVKGVRYWRDTHDLKAGRIEKQIDRAISQNRTVLLDLSEHSLSSDWVEHEVRTARELEKEVARDMLCPVALDDSWKSSHWPKRIMEQIMEYNILDFSEWEDDVKFEGMFRKLIDGLELFYKG